VLDGVFAEDAAGVLRFHPAPAPTDDDMDDVLAAIARRVDRLLARRGVVEPDAAGGADPRSKREPGLVGLSASSIQGRVALGPPRRHARLRKSGDAPHRRTSAPDSARNGLGASPGVLSATASMEGGGALSGTGGTLVAPTFAGFCVASAAVDASGRAPASG
jgi:hypothetical protein